jgi:hypothetical protein
MSFIQRILAQRLRKEGTILWKGLRIFPTPKKSIGLDPGFGSSAFGICITELVDGMINVLYADEFP